MAFVANEIVFIYISPSLKYATLMVHFFRYTISSINYINRLCAIAMEYCRYFRVN